MNLFTRSGSPSRRYILGKGDKVHWVWDPQPGRTYILGVANPVRRLAYRVAILLGWRPIFDPPLIEPFDDSDGLLGTGVLRHPPDSSGSASAAALPGDEPSDIPRR